MPNPKGVNQYTKSGGGKKPSPMADFWAEKAAKDAARGWSVTMSKAEKRTAHNDIKRLVTVNGVQKRMSHNELNAKVKKLIVVNGIKKLV